MLKNKADLAIVVGGYNSSNTSHIVELCEQKLPTYFISSEREIISKNEIKHFDFLHQKHLHTMDFLPSSKNIDIILTSGASCPDSIVDEVLQKIISFFPESKNIDSVIDALK